MKVTTPEHLSDTELTVAVARFAACEREATAQLVAHLAEFDARRLYLGAGFSSLFGYCCEVLGLSEHEAYNRIEAARVARRFPTVLARLSEGAVNLTTVRLLAPHLNDANHVGLLTAATRRSKREVEELIAEHFPRPDVVSSVRKLPGPRTVSLEPVPRPAPIVPAAPTMATPPARRAVVAPLAAERYEVRFTASTGTHQKLRLAQALLRHAIPSGDVAEVFDRALTALLDDLARKKFAQGKPISPRRQRPTAPRSRHVPAAVKRAVWLRDSGRCAFVGKGGRRCAERGFLEFHHVTPYGVGGEPTDGNIELRCRAHNAHEADLFYGPRPPAEGAGLAREPAARYKCTPHSFRNERGAGRDQAPG